MRILTLAAAIMLAPIGAHAGSCLTPSMVHAAGYSADVVGAVREMVNTEETRTPGCASLWEIKWYQRYAAKHHAGRRHPT